MVQGVENLTSQFIASGLIRGLSCLLSNESDHFVSDRLRIVRCDEGLLLLFELRILLDFVVCLGLLLVFEVDRWVNHR